MEDIKTQMARLYPNDKGIMETDLITLRDAGFSEQMAADASTLLESDPQGIIFQFCENVEIGMSLSSICKLIGIPKRSLAEWLHLARNGIEPYATFSLAVSQAEGELEKRWVLEWESAGPPRARQIMDMLERRFPETWAKQSPGSGNNTPSKNQVNIGSMSVMQLPSNGREAPKNVIDVEFEAK